MFRPIYASSSGLLRDYFVLYTIGLQLFYDTGPSQLLRVGSRAAGGRIAISGIPNCLNFVLSIIVLRNLQV